MNASKSLLVVFSALAMISTAHASPAVMGAFESGTPFTIVQPVQFMLQEPGYDGDSSELWGVTSFQNNQIVNYNKTEKTQASCSLWTSLSRNSNQAKTADLATRQELVVFSLTAKSFMGTKTFELTFDRATSALPLYKLECSFPGKKGQAVTLNELNAVLGAYLKPVL